MRLIHNSVTMYPLLRREDPEKTRKVIKAVVEDVKTAVEQGRTAEALHLLNKL